MAAGASAKPAEHEHEGHDMTTHTQEMGAMDARKRNEIAFLFPWAIVLKEIGFFGFMAMMIFLAILIAGFLYEWMKGALEWE